MKTLARLLLLPPAWLYGLLTRMRNHLYNIGYSRSFNYDIMVVLVGNLSTGGTGKSPMVEYLIRLLHSRYSLAVLSRGYKRQTKGFVLAGAQTSAREIGDEPYQFYLKYGDVARVAVGEERTLAIPTLLLEHPETQVILMDDGFQHRSVRADFNILLTDYSRPFYRDLLLPAGRLRESRSGARRARVVVVTKCPATLTEAEQKEVRQHIARYAGRDKPVFFATLAYGNPRPLHRRMPPLPARVVAFAGLAWPEAFFDYVKSKFQVAGRVRFPDHHHYRPDDLRQLLDRARQHRAALITTEKDIVKLREPELASLVGDTPVYYIPVEHRFLAGGDRFDKLVLAAIEDKYRQEE